ncbi:hypothetical protein NC652_030829 [Populus alba x Populus x berolinensis]|nr:hypothetical protein NC652_030829 [Populus alba x Populus x berolinensis]
MTVLTQNSPKLIFYPGRHGLTRIDLVNSVLVENDGFDPKQPETHFLPWSTWFDPVDLVLMEICVPTVLVEEPIVPAAEPQSPAHSFPVFNRRNTPGASSSTPPSASSSEGPRRMRNLEELYDTTQVMEDTTLFCFFADSDPLSFDEAITEEKWIEAMDEEIHAIEKNDTWKLTYLPENKKAIGVKWVYKTKKNAKGEVQRYKARLMAKGYKQREGIDYGEVFAPEARLKTIRLMISLAAQHRWKIYQLDVKSAFMNGFLEEEIYVEQSLGYIDAENEGKVYKLKKALYGLKQAPRAWNTRIDSNNPTMFEDFKRSMVHEFVMTDIGLMSHFLGLEVTQKEEGIFVSQNGYAKDILERFKMESCNPVSTPVENGVELRKSKVGNVDPTYFKSLVGSLRYLTCTRPDILYGVGLISRYMETPDQSHLNAAKRILRYIKGTMNEGMFYTSSKDFNLVGYSDSDWGRDLDERKSTTGFVFFMEDTSFTWSSKKQSIVTLSSCEAEYVATNSAVCHSIWLRNILKFLGFPQENPTEIYIDNRSSITLAKNPVYHERSKHIDTRHHFIREHVKNEEVQLISCNTNDQVANIFTKPLKREKFKEGNHHLQPPTDQPPAAAASRQPPAATTPPPVVSSTNKGEEYDIVIADGEMPELFSNRGEGSSLSFHVPPGSDGNKIQGLVVWVVCAIDGNISAYLRGEAVIRNKSNGVQLFKRSIMLFTMSTNSSNQCSWVNHISLAALPPNAMKAGEQLELSVEVKHTSFEVQKCRVHMIVKKPEVEYFDDS